MSVQEARSAATASPRWESIFAEKIQHAEGCPFQHGDADGDGHECECYVAELWDAIVDEINGSAWDVDGKLRRRSETTGAGGWPL